jgi:hypothetical protein
MYLSLVESVISTYIALHSYDVKDSNQLNVFP